MLHSCTRPSFHFPRDTKRSQVVELTGIVIARLFLRKKEYCTTKKKKKKIPIIR